MTIQVTRSNHRPMLYEAEAQDVRDDPHPFRLRAPRRGAIRPAALPNRGIFERTPE
jgi:hypothetical protein